MGEVFTFIFGILAVVLIIFILSGIKIIRPYQNGLVERLGKFDRILKPGLKIVVPLLETMVKIDLREQVVDIPPQEVITKDNVVATVDAVVFLEVVDPYCYNYNIANFWLAIVNLAQTNLRNVIGDMSLDESLSSRESINAKLQPYVSAGWEVVTMLEDHWQGGVLSPVYKVTLRRERKSPSRNQTVDYFKNTATKSNSVEKKTCPYCGEIIRSNLCEMCGKKNNLF